MEVHTVEELLSQADTLHEAGHFRAAVMEAITALEERVNDVVFAHLEHQKGLPDHLIKWIREKTKMKFEERLHPIGEFALGRQISKSESLWSNYKKAKKIRNDVSHTAKKISASSSKFVIDTVREWLHFLSEAERFGQEFESGEKPQEFFRYFALLSSRFRFNSQSKRQQSLVQAANHLISSGDISKKQRDDILFITKFRNQIAHGQQVSNKDYEVATSTLKHLIRDFKGIEFGPFDL